MKLPKTSSIFIGFACSVASILLGSTAIAQSPNGGFLERFPVKPAGMLSGNKIFTRDGDDAIWMELPDGSVIAGYAFDRNGNDIGAAYYGIAPLDAWASIGAVKPVDPVPVSPAPAGQMTQSGGVSLPAENMPDLPSASNEPVQDPAAVDPMINETIKMATEALGNRSDAEKNELMVELLEAIDAAQNPVHFRLSVIEWTEKVNGAPVIDDETRARLRAESDQINAQLRAPGPGQAPVAEPNKEPAPAGEGISIPSLPLTPGLDLGAIEPGGAQAIPVSQGIDEAQTSPSDDAKIFMDEILTKTSWIEIGDPAAPAVYMFVDPLCPYCAKSFQNLEQDVVDGKIKIRSILVPLVSQNSGSMIAGIMLQDDPSAALWAHELQYARNGASNIPQRDFADLPLVKNDMIRRNRDLVQERGLRGVPFFAWETSDGPKFLSGVPNAGHFSAAVTQ